MARRRSVVVRAIEERCPGGEVGSGDRRGRIFDRDVFQEEIVTGFV